MVILFYLIRITDTAYLIKQLYVLHYYIIINIIVNYFTDIFIMRIEILRAMNVNEEKMRSV